MNLDMMKGGTGFFGAVGGANPIARAIAQGICQEMGMPMQVSNNVNTGIALGGNMVRDSGLHK